MKSATFSRTATRQFLQKKWQQEQAARLRLWQEANDDADAIIAMIIQKYNPRRIYQWGSVLNPGEFSEISDIDIGVEGINSAEAFFAMYGAAMEMTRFPLDLVEIDKIEPEFVRLIKLKGKVVYERQ
jgi:predicted nucleotidyltransferase